MTDVRLRLLERQAKRGDADAAARLDAELWRRGEALTHAPVLRVACPICTQAGDCCSDCFGRGTVPVREDERLRWLAYVGHEEALRLAGWEPRCTYHERVAEWSPNCGTCPPHDQWSPRITTPLGWQRWLSDLPGYLKVACALGAARLVLPPAWEEEEQRLHSLISCTLDACAAWLRDPTTEHREAWGDAWSFTDADDFWPPAPGFLHDSSVRDEFWRRIIALYGDKAALHDGARAQAVKLLLKGEEMR